jgi:glycosyltransferase involved in cell wall biosynthesis
MNDNPLVSILIPNFNKASYLRETLDSVLTQTYTNWECIIVDDHSTDNSWEIMEEFASKDSRFRIYKRPIDRRPGGNAARNYAFKQSKGDYINWFDSDDIIAKTKLEEQLSVFRQTECDFVLCTIGNFTSDINFFEPHLGFEFELNSDKWLYNYLNGSFWFGTPIPLFKRRFIDDLDFLFNEDLMRNQEMEFFTRILSLKPRIEFLNKILVLRRLSESSKKGIYIKIEYPEKLVLDAPAFLSVYSHLKEVNFFDKYESKFFQGWFLNFLEFSKYNFRLLTKVFLIYTLERRFNLKKMVFKSYLFRVIHGK